MSLNIPDMDFEDSPELSNNNNPDEGLERDSDYLHNQHEVVSGQEVSSVDQEITDRLVESLQLLQKYKPPLEFEKLCLKDVAHIMVARDFYLGQIAAQEKQRISEEKSLLTQAGGNAVVVVSTINIDGAFLTQVEALVPNEEYIRFRPSIDGRLDTGKDFRLIDMEVHHKLVTDASDFIQAAVDDMVQFINSPPAINLAPVTDELAIQVLNTFKDINIHSSNVEKMVLVGIVNEFGQVYDWFEELTVIRENSAIPIYIKGLLPNGLKDILSVSLPEIKEVTLNKKIYTAERGLNFVKDEFERHTATIMNIVSPPVIEGKAVDNQKAVVVATASPEDPGLISSGLAYLGFGSPPATTTITEKSELITKDIDPETAKWMNARERAGLVSFGTVADNPKFTEVLELNFKKVVKTFKENILEFLRTTSLDGGDKRRLTAVAGDINSIYTRIQRIDDTEAVWNASVQNVDTGIPNINFMEFESRDREGKIDEYLRLCIGSLVTAAQTALTKLREAIRNFGTRMIGELTRRITDSDSEVRRIIGLVGTNIFDFVRETPGWENTFTECIQMLTENLLMKESWFPGVNGMKLTKLMDKLKSGSTQYISTLTELQKIIGDSLQKIYTVSKNLQKQELTEAILAVERAAAKELHNLFGKNFYTEGQSVYMEYFIRVSTVLTQSAITNIVSALEGIFEGLNSIIINKESKINMIKYIGGMLPKEAAVEKLVLLTGTLSAAATKATALGMFTAEAVSSGQDFASLLDRTGIYAGKSMNDKLNAYVSLAGMSLEGRALTHDSWVAAMKAGGRSTVDFLVGEFRRNPAASSAYMLITVMNLKSGFLFKLVGAVVGQIAESGKLAGIAGLSALFHSLVIWAIPKIGIKILKYVNPDSKIPLAGYACARAAILYLSCGTSGTFPKFPILGWGMGDALQAILKGTGSDPGTIAAYLGTFEIVGWVALQFSMCLLDVMQIVAPAIWDKIHTEEELQDEVFRPLMQYDKTGDAKRSAIEIIHANREESPDKLFTKILQAMVDRNSNGDIRVNSMVLDFMPDYVNKDLRTF